MSDAKEQDSQAPDLDISALEAEGQEPRAVDAESDLEVKVEADQQGTDQPGEIDAELAAVQAEVSTLKDSFLRAKAEQDNIRRRSEKEVANSRKFAVENFAKEMLNVRDSLTLACSQELDNNTDDAVKNIYEGVTITLKQLDSVFAKFALVVVAPQPGDKLDPNLHQAMSLIESDEVESGCVINVIQDGFTLHDRLLRPAMVIVAK